MQNPTPGHHSVFRANAVYALATWVISTLTIVGTTSVAFSQTEDPATGAAKSLDVVNPPTPDMRFSVGWVSAMGTYTYVPERWGELHINLVNKRNEPRELVCLTHFDEQPLLQFGRKVWLPGRSKLQISHPVLVPKSASPQERSMMFHSLIFDNDAVDEELIKNESGQLLQDGAILLTQESRTTAIIGKMVNKEFTPPEEVIDLVVGGRACHDLTDKLTLLGDNFLPADETSLNCFEQIVIAEERIANDLAAMTALRHWLNSGGHLWIMLDRVDMRTLEALLGDDFNGYLVDRVGLTSVRVDQSPVPGGSDGSIGEIREFEEPVQMARVVIPGMDVAYTVNQWPASLTRRYGSGLLLITTVGARGWMKPRDSTSRRPSNERKTPRHVPNFAMDTLATTFFGPREPDFIPSKTFEPHVREYVGYSVPSWGLIIGMLSGFSFSLLVAGILLWRAGRLEHLGWVGAGVAVAVSILLLVIGHSYRHRIGETIASVQIAQALVGTDEVRTDGLIAVYHPEGSDSQIRTAKGGRMLPEMTGIESSTRRMVATDFDVWHWENLKQPAGLRMNSFTKSETVPERIEAHVTLNSNGIMGKYSGHLPPGADAMLATRHGRIGVNIQNDGSFVARGQDVFEREQYLNASLVGDEQDRRRHTLETVFNNAKRREFPDRPQLMFWSDRWENGFEFAEGVKPQNSTLVCVPLVIHRPANGTKFFIPSPILPYRNRMNPDGTPPSTMWNYNRNEWQDRADPGSTWLSFQVPRELLPLSVKRAQIDINVSGPVGLIEIQGLKNGTVTSLKKVIDPVGRVSFEIDDPTVLSIRNDGMLDLGIIAGDASRPELTRMNSEPTDSSAKSRGMDLNTKVNYWRIDSLELQLWATADEPALQE